MATLQPLLPCRSEERQEAGQALRSPARVVGALAAAGALVLVLATVALQRAQLPAALTQLAGDAPSINDKFLHAISGGKQGGDFVQRLEDTWFVEKHNGREDLAEAATELAGGMMIAGFPEDMHAAVDTNVNPCEDFYEFACGKWDYDNRNKIPVRVAQLSLRQSAFRVRDASGQVPRCQRVLTVPVWPLSRRRTSRRWPLRGTVRSRRSGRPRRRCCRVTRVRPACTTSHAWIWTTLKRLATSR